MYSKTSMNVSGNMSWSHDCEHVKQNLEPSVRTKIWEFFPCLISLKTSGFTVSFECGLHKYMYSSTLIISSPYIFAKWGMGECFPNCQCSVGRSCVRRQFSVLRKRSVCSGVKMPFQYKVYWGGCEKWCEWCTRNSLLVNWEMQGAFLSSSRCCSLQSARCQVQIRNDLLNVVNTTRKESACPD